MNVKDILLSDCKIVSSLPNTDRTRLHSIAWPCGT